MATETPTPNSDSKPPAAAGQTAARSRGRFAAAAAKYAIPIVVLILACVVLVTITTNWNAWKGDRTEQVTDDAYVRGNLTPLSTKVAGIVKEVKVSDYQQVQKGDLLFKLEDNDFRAQVAQAMAAVEAAKAALEAKENLARITEEVELNVQTRYNKLERMQQMVQVSQELLALRTESKRVSNQELARGAALQSQAASAVGQELDAQTTLLQSQLDYIQAYDEMIHAMGGTPE
jgi:membrane fusion protein, multidrug efflux system